jgi:hypothetical protein
VASSQKSLKTINNLPATRLQRGDFIKGMGSRQVTAVATDKGDVLVTFDNGHQSYYSPTERISVERF